MTMGLAWQQAPHGPNPAGRFLTRNPIPEHVLYAEPAGRRMRVELAGAVPESARLRGYVSFDPGQLDVSVDAERLLPAAHQQVVPAGTDRDLAVRTS